LSAVTCYVYQKFQIKIAPCRFYLSLAAKGRFTVSRLEYGAQYPTEIPVHSFTRSAKNAPMHASKLSRRRITLPSHPLFAFFRLERRGDNFTKAIDELRFLAGINTSNSGKGEISLRKLSVNCVFQVNLNYF
jgi:hypothetical protein